ncbi:RNase A-like domain-containing protein [Kineococcus sp. SYSU DK006]|uniref:RNase A-like domain-containing protein n=1 Tax=Kineococcus sp. SYSU DK006 TaxID=3383127 RepID=UPI003D7C9699
MDELSTLSPEAADGAAAAARAVAAELAGTTTRVAAAVDAVGGWYGAARGGFADRVAELHGHLGLLTGTAAAGAGLIEAFSRELGALRGRLRGVDTAVERVQQRIGTGIGIGDLASWHADHAELEHWQASRRQALAEFDTACADLAQRLLALVHDVPDRPRRAAEHVDDAVHALAAGVGDQAHLVLGWAWDAPGWRRSVAGLPARLLEAAEHPVGTALAATPLDDLADGRYGAAAGSLATALLGRGVGRGPGPGPRDAPPPGSPLHRYLAADGNPLPQALGDLLTGVDLRHSEVFAGAHTIARHVDVDDAFLRRRLRTGEVEGGLVQRRPPDAASRWADLETAQARIGEVLRTHREEIAQEAASGERSIEVRAPAPASAGSLWVREADGRITAQPVSSCKVVLSRAADGSWFVKTAYLE